MAVPVVIVDKGGVPITEATNGFGTPIEVATNGFGIAVTYSDKMGIPVVTKGIPLQVVGSRGEINAIEGSAVTTANLKQAGRSRHYIGTRDQSEIIVCFNGFFVDSATGGNGQTCAEVNATNSYTIKASAEINGTVVQFTFSGAAQGTVVSGSTLFLSDPLYPAAFGLTKFDAQTLIWIKCEREFLVGDKGMFHQTASNNPVISGESYFIGATTATSQLATAGALSTTGGWTQQSHIWLPYCILGRPIGGKMMSAMTVGASIENGVNDGQGDGLNGAGGYMRRMLAAVATKKIARIHLAKSGETAKSFIANSAKRMAMLPYVTHCFSGHGGNDYSTGESLANTETRQAASWAILKGTSSRYVEHYALSPKSDSTDAWATVVNQTPRTGYETGGAWRTAGNTWAAAQVATNDNLDGFVDLAVAQVDSVAADKWRVDLGQPTTDGTHPNAVIAAAMATQAATHIEALRSAYEG